MKYNKSKFILTGLCASMAMAVSAQEATAEAADSIASKKVNVAFRQVDENDLLGGVSSVDVKSLLEKNYFTYSLDAMQTYVGGFNGNSLWGQDHENNQGYLVLVDGFPRPTDNTLPTEIESITFLKGAQAVVLYGSRAAKGAILITTRRGTADGLDIDVRLNTGFEVMKNLPEYMGSAEYMAYYNQNKKMDGDNAFYSDDEINFSALGKNPYRYPNVNFFSSDYIKQYRNRTDVSVELNGGGDRTKFYSNVGYYRMGDYLNFGEAKDNYISRLNIRGNVDIKITDNIKAVIDANATFYDAKTANGSFWSASATMRPNYPVGAAPLIPVDMIDPNATEAIDLIKTTNNVFDGMFLAGSQGMYTNAIADIYAAGTSTFTSRNLQFNTGVEFNLRDLLEGLKFKTDFAFDYSTDYTTSYNNKYAIFTPTWSNYQGKDVIVALKKENDDVHDGKQNISISDNSRTAAYSAQFNYDNTFDGVHNVSAIVLGNMFQQTTAGQYHRVANANLGWLAAYNYDHKYYVNYAANMIHSAKLAEGHRQAVSNTFELGWRLTKESFLEDNGIFDDLLISASYGIINQDIDIKVGDNEYYLADPQWGQEYGYGWYDGASEKYTTSIRGANPGLEPIKRKEISVNLKASMFNKMITLDASYFQTKSEGYLIDNSTAFPDYMNIGYPKSSFIAIVNNNNNKRWGYDFSVNFNKKFGEVDFQLGINGTYYDTEATKRDENNIESEQYKNRVGKALDGVWGLECLGIIRTEEQLAEALKCEYGFGHTPRLGDLMYKDQNGDGKIDTNDRVELARGNGYGEPLSLGVNLSAKWNGFTVFALVTGGFGGHGYKNNSYYWMNKDSKYSAIARECWSETNPNALYPRISESTGGNNNHIESDFWLYKTDHIDLAKIQLTYDLPSSIFEGIFIKGASAFVNGSNLLTIAEEKEYMEMYVGSEPRSRFFNCGIKVKF